MGFLLGVVGGLGVIRGRLPYTLPAFLAAIAKQSFNLLCSTLFLSLCRLLGTLGMIRSSASWLRRGDRMKIVNAANHRSTRGTV